MCLPFRRILPDPLKHYTNQKLFMFAASFNVVETPFLLPNVPLLVDFGRLYCSCKNKKYFGVNRLIGKLQRAKVATPFSACGPEWSTVHCTGISSVTSTYSSTWSCLTNFTEVAATHLPRPTAGVPYSPSLRTIQVVISYQTLIYILWTQQNLKSPGTQSSTDSHDLLYC